MKLRKITSGIMAAIMAFSVVGTPVGDIFPEVSKKISASATPEETALVKASATGYSYTITPLLAPFNEYFFVKTDNPDPTSFRFADKTSVYIEDEPSVISAAWDSWDDKPYIYQDIRYQNKNTGRVDGGYIFCGSYTDGGEIVLQTKSGSDSYNVTWNDTKIKLKLPALKDDVDYLIDRYATKSSFFDNMDAVQEGFSSICLYSGSYIKGKLKRATDYWGMSTSPHKDQLFYIQSPYTREDSKSLFASAIYPYRYDSLGFPSVMSIVAKRLDSSAQISWDDDYHYMVNVTYKGNTRSYGGQGNGKGQGISEDKIKQYYTFGNGGTKITLEGTKKLLNEYSQVEMKDDVPRAGSITWKSIYNTVGNGSWVRLIEITGIFGGSQIGYSYLYRNGDGSNFYTDSAGNSGSEIYWGGDLGYASDVWVDGRYVDAWEGYVPGEKFEDHPHSDILLKMSVPQIKYEYENIYNEETGLYDTDFTIISVSEVQKSVLFSYQSDDNLWRCIDVDELYDDDCASYYDVEYLVREGLLDKKYLRDYVLTPDDVAKLKVDRNTNKIPDDYYIYDQTVKPGTSLKNHTHDYVTDSVVKPTYTAQGYTLQKCKICGAGKKINYTAKLTLSKVTGFKVKSISSTNVTLKWNKNANASGYEIEQYKGGKWVNVAKITSNATTSYTIKGLKAGTAGYQFRIRAYRTEGKNKAYSGYSSIVKVNTNPYGVSGFKCLSKTSTSVTLKWNKGTTASGYQLQQYKGGKWVTIYTGTKATNTSYTVKKLKAGTAGYRFRIRAYKTYGNNKQYGSWSSEVKVNTNPYGVGGFKVKATTKNSITLGWNKGTTASGYQLQQYKGGKWVTIYTGTKATNTSYTVKGLKAGTAGYRFRIRAYKTYGNTKQYGSWSSEVKVNTNPYGVGGFKAKSTAKNSITLGWNKGTTASGYQLQQYKGGKWVTVYTGTKATSTSYTVKSLKANTSYKFRIRAYKTYGSSKQYGSWSKVLTVKTKR